MRGSHKKAIALALCSAMAVSALAGVGSVQSSAAERITDHRLAVRTEAATGDSITDATPTPEASEPAGDDSAQNSPAPTLPAPSTPATGGVTSGASVTTPGAATGSVLYAVGQTFKKGDFNYYVTKAATATAPGKVRVRLVAVASRGKTSLKVPDSIKKSGYQYTVAAIATKSFKKCTALQSVTVGANVKTINSRAFQGLSTLTTVKLGTGVTKINLKAFAGCKKLRKVTLTKNIATLGKQVFYNCTKLKAVIVNTRKLTKIKTGAFSKISKDATVLVPSGKLSKYSRLFTKASNKTLTYRSY